MYQPMTMSNLDRDSRPLTPEEELAKKKLENQKMATSQQKNAAVGDAIGEALPTDTSNASKYQKMMQAMQPQQSQVDALTQQRQKTLQRLLGA